MKALFTALCIAAVLAGCKGEKGPQADWSEARQDMEVRGQQLLNESRKALSRHDYEQARRHIHTLRDKCDLAFTAREAGILLMDSIDLQEAVSGMLATDSLMRQHPQAADSLSRVLGEYNDKIKFFRRKLEHDRSAKSAANAPR